MAITIMKEILSQSKATRGIRLIMIQISNLRNRKIRMMVDLGRGTEGVAFKEGLTKFIKKVKKISRKG